MDVLAAIWTFIVSHWHSFMDALIATKTVTDTIDSVKKVLPARLESKQITQEYLEKSVDLLNDQSIPVEDKKWELNTRQELVKSMVQLTKPRHGGFTYPGSEDDRCPIHQDGGKIFFCSEQTNVAHPTLARAAVDRDFPASQRDSACRCT